MKIIVLMKQVANKDAVLRISGDETWINEADVALQTNESDGYALEEALRTVEAKGEGEVVVCTLGPQSAKSVIKDALARGAHRAIHIVVEDSKSLSSYQIASTIADAIRDEKAELLGRPSATIVIEVDRESLAGTLRVKRELESGWYQWFTYQLPALLTIQSGISQIRYASLKGIMAAKSKPVSEVTPTIEPSASAPKIEKVYMPLKTKQTQMLGNGDAKAGAVELVEKLRSEVRVI